MGDAQPVTLIERRARLLRLRRSLKHLRTKMQAPLAQSAFDKRIAQVEYDLASLPLLPRELPFEHQIEQKRHEARHCAEARGAGHGRVGAGQ